MPAELWREAVALARDGGTCQIARAVRVDYESLARRVAEAGASEGGGDAPRAAFVELTGAQLLGSSTLSGPVVEMADANGVHVTIRLVGGAPLGVEDLAALQAAVNTLVFLTRELEAKGTTIERLRRLLFGASTEKTSQVVGTPAAETPTAGGGQDDAAGTERSAKPKAPGHGRHGAAAYRGATKIHVPHESLSSGGPTLSSPSSPLERVMSSSSKGRSLPWPLIIGIKTVSRPPDLLFPILMSFGQKLPFKTSWTTSIPI
jgi:hypothetical protein